MVYNFSSGSPHASLLPIDAVQSHPIAPELLASALKYGPYSGDPHFLACLGNFLRQADPGAAAGTFDAPRLMATAGNSHAVDLVLNTFCEPGDVVLAEQYTYFKVMRLFRERKVAVRGLAFDEEGLMIDGPQGLLSHITACRNNGQTIKMVYTIPFHQNPTGVHMSERRRTDLMRVCQQHGILLVADEAYRFLSFDGRVPSSLAASQGLDHVITLGSFSKILAPGLRVGWIEAAPAHIQRLSGNGVLWSGGAISHYSSMLVSELLASQFVFENIGQLRRAYSRRAGLLVEGLREGLGAAAGAAGGDSDDQEQRVQFGAPAGGFFVWATLPRGASADELLEWCQRGSAPGTAPGDTGTGAVQEQDAAGANAAVDFRPGSLFRTEALAGAADAAGAGAGGGAGAAAERCFRLSFSGMPEGEIRDASVLLGRRTAEYLLHLQREMAHKQEGRELRPQQRPQAGGKAVLVAPLRASLRARI
jgi:DNA-binding transcriptional MocR family regulator